ncbi:MAG: tRNA uridine-5-carboxymethylaminomethyl(34) synthesis GTPase MnmE, partial [bacterium]|nr:tRNA uridine-5-carboxymethylaminomethyl(34) synthesis GTPase MnmE [bacterium]
NIDILKKKIYENVINSDVEACDFTTNQRQQESLKNALLYLENALCACKRGELQDLISIDIKSALISLGEITGEVIND